MTGERCRGTDRISLTSLPFFFESADIKIAYRFATLVEHPGLSHELLFNGPGRAESDTYGI